MIKFLKNLISMPAETLPVRNEDLSSKSETHLEIALEKELFDALKNDDVEFISQTPIENLKNFKGDAEHKYMPLHFLAAFYLKNKVLEFLLKNGFKAKDTFEGSPLMEFTILQSGEGISTIKILLENGADPTQRNADGQSCLDYAVALNKLGIVEFLLNLGINVNEKNQVGRTSLMMAGSCSKPDTINLLISKGADILARDHNGNTAFYYSIKNNNYEMIVHFVKNYNHSLQELDGWGQNVLFYFNATTSIHFVKHCVGCGVDINLQGIDGNTSLHISFKNERFDIADILIAAGASTNIKNSKGEFPSDLKIPKDVGTATWKVMELLKQLPKDLDFIDMIQVQKALSGHKFLFLDEIMPEPQHNEDNEHFSSEQRVQMMRDLVSKNLAKYKSA